MELRDDRTESCHLLWFWQQAFSSQPPLDGQCTPDIRQGKSKAPATQLPDESLACTAIHLLRNGIKPRFYENVPFTKQGIKRFVLVSPRKHGYNQITSEEQTSLPCTQIAKHKPKATVKPLRAILTQHCTAP